MTDRIERVVIVGGGTAGWMTAAALGYVLGGSGRQVTLVESEEIGTVGVGEATIPPITTFNDMLGLDEDEFVKATNATFKLGIEFRNWGKLGDAYIHPFGDFGLEFDALPFYQYWARQWVRGEAASLFDYSLMVQACREEKFERARGHHPKSPLSGIRHAFQFDAALYAALLRKVAEKSGVKRVEGRIVDVAQDGETGFVTSVTTDRGDTLSADMFIDCSGFRGLLIEQTLKTGYTDWSSYLPCDRAFAVPSEKTVDPIPYTTATAHSAGWQWRIPLQHRTGNGHVFCSGFMEEDEARQILLDNLDSPPLAEPKLLKFTTGHRNKFWNKNVIALGLAAGFAEPLESTSIHMIQSGIARLLMQFPDKRFLQVDIDSYNERMLLEFERVRDFLVLHYTATERTDSEFWRHCQTIEQPPVLKRKIEQFRETGRIFEEPNELFSTASWLAVMFGQNIAPQAYHPVTDKADNARLNEVIAKVHNAIEASVAKMPSHQAFIDANCLSPDAKMAAQV